jgi:hypothetical protein
MNPFLLTYLIGVIVIPIAFLILNYKYKWMTKNSHKFDVTNACFIDFSVEFFLATLMWPIILIFGLIGGILHLIYKLCIPNK